MDDLSIHDLPWSLCYKPAPGPILISFDPFIGCTGVSFDLTGCLRWRRFLQSCSDCRR